LRAWHPLSLRLRPPSRVWTYPRYLCIMGHCWDESAKVPSMCILLSALHRGGDNLLHPLCIRDQVKRHKTAKGALLGTHVLLGNATNVRFLLVVEYLHSHLNDLHQPPLAPLPAPLSKERYLTSCCSSTERTCTSRVDWFVLRTDPSPDRESLRNRRAFTQLGEWPVLLL
jgi:hypothetical protein